MAKSLPVISNLFGLQNESEFNNIKPKILERLSKPDLPAAIKLDKQTNMQLQGNYKTQNLPKQKD